MTEDRHSSLTGILIDDRYRVESQLGSGGMGLVYRARDLRLERDVVLKIPREAIQADPQLRGRFLAEVRELARHEHPHILKIQDFGEEGGIPYAALQYLGGGDLDERIRGAGGRLALTEVLGWLPPIAAALDFIHARDCLHRDVKPANIIFDESGNPFLADFGIAKAMREPTPDDVTQPLGVALTSAGSIIGTSAFVPPEAVDRVFTPAYDQYGLATVVYLALSGAYAFPGRTAQESLRAKYLADPVPLSEDIPQGCREAVMRGLARDPADRHGSCAAFAEAFQLGAVAPRGGGRATRRTVAALASGVAIAASAVSLWFFFEPGPLGSKGPAGPALELRLGSTPAELAAAKRLCELSRGRACDPREFEGEELRMVSLNPTAVDRFEVTNRAFERFATEEEHQTLAEIRGSSRDGPFERSDLSWRNVLEGIAAVDRPGFPVVHVSFVDANAYCASQGKRLPNADEWEYHARGEERRIFPWGNEWAPGSVAFGGRSAAFVDVGSHAEGATPEGIHDMAGSVWEWTSTPQGDGRVIKGGSWQETNSAALRAAAVTTVPDEYSSADLGFRCIQELTR